VKWIRENHDLLESFIWIALIAPTLLWWKDAVLWVALMSLYANHKTAFSSWQANRAKREAEKNNGENNE
jgi:hypothetical protein